MSNCPICEEPAQSSCRCFRSDSVCRNGHEWHTCLVHQKVSLGHAPHDIPSDVCTCNEKTLACMDCKKSYQDFPLDVVLPDSQWELISGRKDGGGILCAACIVERASKLEKVTVAKMYFPDLEDGERYPHKKRPD